MKTLLFVYNTTTNVFDLLTEAAHKIFSPETVECNLCSLTYGTALKKKEWKEFLESIDMEKKFHLKDTFQKKYPAVEADFPAVFIMDDNNEPEILVTADELNRAETLEEMIVIVQAGINTIEV